MRIHVIIVAGGVGKRFGADQPKQFLPLQGVPVLVRTVCAFIHSLPQANITLALPADQIQTWLQIARDFGLPGTIKTVCGGQERFHSVKNCLDLTGDDGITAVHDGVRPLISKALINRCIQAAANHDTAVPAITPGESVRIVQRGGKNTAIDRNQVRLIQTPQCFKTALLKEAYQQPYRPAFTDDASVAEAAGYPIHLVEGEPHNIKITKPVDLIIAEALLNHSQFSG